MRGTRTNRANHGERLELRNCSSVGLITILWFVHSVFMKWNRTVHKTLMFCFLFFGAFLSVYVAIAPVLLVFFGDVCDAIDQSMR